ncbi:hypothetical protein C7B65_06510 [Phormidesmis priestleyi ULC007]|uniref:Uncharacterized protein n=1 Tax=Phormidesmis priestleyi ULC007 TaxID=1920490 RepID=A0A2T1DJA3_9CYAN|nr:hypothetical protein [Phormidesmis priestleyi]PSB20553.1 hypothetical protein C7B65_06510 [Phormidesmis priestleyi ULC007]PZO54223.1 MAG: hypothetical protein DCF14_02155 [Phormidesmis priestleyi]
MSTRKTVLQLQRQLDEAKRRAAYVAPQREEGAATQRRPKSAIKYGCTSAPSTDFTIQGSKAGIIFFGGEAALGLADAGSDPTAPKGFHPNRIYAMISDASPQVVRAKASNRAYTRYARGTRGSNTQSTFSAPISDITTPTMASVRAKFGTVANSKKDEVGGSYGRIWFEPERLPLVESGN